MDIINDIYRLPYYRLVEILAYFGIFLLIIVMIELIIVYFNYMNIKRNIINYIFDDELSEMKHDYNIQLMKLNDGLVKLDKSIKQSDNLQNYYLELIQKLKNTIGSLDVSVDVHEKSNSWCAISIQDKTSDYIKFIDLGRSDVNEIKTFLTKFDKSNKIKINATPQFINFLKFDK